MTLPESDACHLYHDWGESDLCATIGMGLLEATDQQLGDLGTPLYDVLDVDALEALLVSEDETKGTVDQIRFTVDGHTVTVSNHDELAHIVVHPHGTTPHSLPGSLR